MPPPHRLALQWCLIYVCSLFPCCRLLFAHHEIANSAIWGLGAKSLSQSRLAECKCDGCRSAEPKRDQNSSSPKTTYNRRGRRLKDVWDYGLISWAVQNICHHEDKISITIWSRVLNEEHSSQSSKRMLSGGSYCGFCLCLVCLVCDSECGCFTNVPVWCDLLFLSSSTFHLPSYRVMSRHYYCCNVQYFLDILALLLIFISDVDFQRLFLQLSDSIIQLYWRFYILPEYSLDKCFDRYIMIKSGLYFVSVV